MSKVTKSWRGQTVERFQQEIRIVADQSVLGGGKFVGGADNLSGSRERLVIPVSNNPKVWIPKTSYAWVVAVLHREIGDAERRGSGPENRGNADNSDRVSAILKCREKTKCLFNGDCHWIEFKYPFVASVGFSSDKYDVASLDRYMDKRSRWSDYPVAEMQALLRVAPIAAATMPLKQVRG